MRQVSVLMQPISASIPAQDPVEMIGRQLGDVVRAMLDMDEMSVKCSDEIMKSHVNITHEQLVRRQRILEESIAASRATTIGGALVDIIRAQELANVMASQLLELGAAQRQEFSDIVSQLSAVLYSAASVLKQLEPDVFKAAAGDFYMDERFDPFLFVEKAASLKERVEKVAA